MPDLEMWRWTANCKPSVERSILEGNLGAYLKDACNVIEALERENAAMAKVVEAARTYLMFELACCHRDCASHDGDSDCNCGYVAAHDALDELAALAPATSKEPT